MSGSGTGDGVIIPTGREPGSTKQKIEPPCNEVWPKTIQVVVSKLIDDDYDDELGLVRGGRSLCEYVRPPDYLNNQGRNQGEGRDEESSRAQGGCLLYGISKLGSAPRHVLTHLQGQACFAGLPLAKQAIYQE